MSEAFVNEDSTDSEVEAWIEEHVQEDQQPAEEEAERPRIDARMDHLPPPIIRENIDPRGFRTSANTGPKGVKADYKEAQHNVATIRMREELRRQRNVEALATGPKQFFFSEKAPVKAKKPSDSDSDCDSEDEDLQKSRLDGLRLTQASLPEYGTFEKLSKAEWFDALKHAHELVFVVTHVYENDIPACTKLNLCLEALAPLFSQVRFCRIRSTEAMKSYSRVGLPALIIHKGDKMVHSFVKVTSQFNGEITDRNVAQFLAKHGILKDPTSVLTAPKASTRPSATAALDLDDEDDRND